MKTAKGFKKVRRRGDYTLFILSKGEWCTGGNWNGYVAIPEGHPLNGKSQLDIWGLIDGCNGGITWSAKPTSLRNEPKLKDTDWVIGFDTQHSWDYPESWTEHGVMRVVEDLYNQLVKLK